MGFWVINLYLFIYAYRFNKLAYLKTNVDFGLQDKTIAKDFKKYLKKLKY